MSSPLFSVIIPLYNKRPYIARAIRSVLSQEVSDFEVIVIDDGSHDGSGQEARTMTDPRVRVIQREHRGKSATRNEGIAEAGADLVAFLDADDEWLPRFASEILMLTKRYPEAGACATAYFIHKGFRSLVCRSGKAKLGEARQGLLTDLSRSVDLMCASAVAVKKSVFAQVGGFRRGIVTGEDRDMWLRIAARYPVAYSATPCAIWHYGVAGSDSKTLLPAVPSSMNESLREILADANLGVSVKQRASEFVARQELRDALLMVRRGHNRNARKALRVWRTRHGVSSAWLIHLAATLCPSRVWTFGREIQARVLSLV